MVMIMMMVTTKIMTDVNVVKYYLNNHYGQSKKARDQTLDVAVDLKRSKLKGLFTIFLSIVQISYFG